MLYMISIEILLKYNDTHYNVIFIDMYITFAL